MKEEEELTNYLHNKFKEEGKYIGKRFIKECIEEGIKLNHCPSQQTSVVNREIVYTKKISNVGEIPALDTQICKCGHPKDKHWGIIKKSCRVGYCDCEDYQEKELAGVNPKCSKEECSLCEDTLENTQLICWTCFCKMKDKVRQSKLKEELEFLKKIKEILRGVGDIGMLNNKIKMIEKELSGGKE